MSEIINNEVILEFDDDQEESIDLDFEVHQDINEYNYLFNKPRINGVVLIGDKSSREIHVQHEMDEVTPQDIDEIIYGS